MAVQAGLCLAWSETPEDTFCHVMAQMEMRPPISGLPEQAQHKRHTKYEHRRSFHL